LTCLTFLPWNARPACLGSSNQKDDDETESEDQSGCLGENHKKRPPLPMCLSQFAGNSEGSRTPEKKQGGKALATPHTSEK